MQTDINKNIDKFQLKINHVGTILLKLFQNNHFVKSVQIWTRKNSVFGHFLCGAAILP